MTDTAYLTREAADAAAKGKRSATVEPVGVAFVVHDDGPSTTSDASGALNAATADELRAALAARS